MITQSKTGDSCPPLGRADAVLIAYWYPPANTSGAARPYRFFKYLPDFGWNVDVVAAGEAASGAGVHYVPALPKRFAARLIALCCRLVQKMFFQGNPRLDWFSNAWPQLAAMARRRNGSVIVSTSPPIVTHLLALALKMRFGTKWVADFRDPFLGSPFGGQKPSLLAKWLERAIVRHADALVANTDAAARLLLERYPRASAKLSIIWNGFDPEEHMPSQSTAPGERRVIAHVGDIYGLRHPGPFFDALDRLKRSGLIGDFCVRLIGPMDSDSPFRTLPSFARLKADGLVEAKGIVVSRECSLQAMCDADILLLLDVFNAPASVQLPAKIFDYIRARRPIIALTTPGSPAEKVLDGAGVSYVSLYRTDSESESDAKIKKFLDTTGESASPAEWFWEHFNGREQARVLADLLSHLKREDEARETNPCALPGQRLFTEAVGR